MLGQIFPSENIIVNLESEDKDEVFEEMVEVLVSVQPQINREEVLAALRLREAKMSTGVMPGIAVPHAISTTIKGLAGAIGISHKGIEYDALDEHPVHIIFMLLFAPLETEQHLQVMRELSGILQMPDFTKVITSKKTPQEVHDAICAFEAELAGL
jgi:nitrogen PTS system EIIA component